MRENGVIYRNIVIERLLVCGGVVRVCVWKERERARKGDGEKQLASFQSSRAAGPGGGQGNSKRVTIVR